MRPLGSTAIVLAVAAATSAADPAPLVPAVRDAVQPNIEKHMADAHKATLAELAKAGGIPAGYKAPLRQRAVKDAWVGLAELEAKGLALAAASRGGLAGVPDLLDRAGQLLDRPAGKPAAVPAGKLDTLDDHLAYIAAILDAAAKLRDEALAKLTPEDRTFVFDRPAKLIHEFGPQLTLSDRTRPALRDDKRFCAVWAEQTDGPKFAAAVRTLLLLTDPAYLDRLKAVMAAAKPAPGPADVGGTVLAARETPHGLILLGGGDANTYDGKRPVAFLADLGGDDSYQGCVGASFDAAHPFGLLIDFAGADTYAPAELGLAAGRLGCGGVIDRAGNDTYKLAPGSGGCGFAGVGLLIDEAGADTYAGTRYTQGAAVAGVGLLLDVAGDDTYTADAYAVGLGGPAGVGAVVDVAGDDRYRVGFKEPSGYNSSDAPTAKPGDPGFQYDAFGLGTGLGRRTYPATDEGTGYHLAGGVGAVIDVSGNDRSEASNFAQACGYFFGAGLRLDLAGDDRHGAARYGHAAGAHYGMGLFLDYAGDDEYASDGPTYNLGCGWDRSVFLLADGRGRDAYDLTRSSGGGRGDHGGWGVFADLLGADRYRGGVAGGATDKGLGVFLDADGTDEYPPGGPANGASRHDGGAAVIDR